MNYLFFANIMAYCVFIASKLPVIIYAPLAHQYRLTLIIGNLYYINGKATGVEHQNADDAQKWGINAAAATIVLVLFDLSWTLKPERSSPRLLKK